MTDQPANSAEDKPVRESLTHQPVTARVPERVARGVFTTGQLVLDGPKEFVIDFLQGLTRPFQVASRVVMTPGTMSEFIAALRINLDNYTRSFGPPPPFNPPQPQPRPTIQEIYENFKLADDQLSGSYSNSVLIGHSQTEFFFDFITGFYPTPAVSARVLIPASHVPRFLNTLKTCLDQYQSRGGAPPPAPNGPQGGV
ncbi:MAG: DUF3467 domain-containing protein [Tepidisphaeraceae bacterium]